MGRGEVEARSRRGRFGSIGSVRRRTGDADGASVAFGSMFCAVSGTTPKEPVVTPKGVLYERSVIVKAIEVRRSDDDDGECCARAMEMRRRRLERFGRRLTNGELARADVFNAVFFRRLESVR